MTDFNEIVLMDRKARMAERDAVRLAAGSEAPDDAGEAGAGDMAKRRASKKSTGKTPERGGTSASERWDTFNTFVRDTMPTLGEATVKVWLRLFSDTKKDGIAWAGGTYLATATGLTRRGVVKAVKELRRRGLVKLVHRGSVNGQPNGYRVSGRGRLGNGGSLA